MNLSTFLKLGVLLLVTQCASAENWLATGGWNYNAGTITLANQAQGYELKMSWQGKFDARNWQALPRSARFSRKPPFIHRRGKREWPQDHEMERLLQFLAGRTAKDAVADVRFEF